MKWTVDETHNEALRSWIESANDPGGDFPIQNLPFGVFARGDDPRVGIAIGDRILDVTAARRLGLFHGAAEVGGAAAACAKPSLNALMALGPDAWRSLRREVSGLLCSDVSADRRARVEGSLVRMADATMLLPAEIGDYTDFYASVHHATNVGSMFRPDSPLLPNYKYVPIGYHGRASSVLPSGTPVRRPMGQMKEEGSAPVYGPSRRLDYECEVGVFVGPGNALGSPIALADVGRHMFGLCLVNDWSARDIQTWEYQPLGPFLAKSFATSVSPWVVTMDALAPYRRPAYSRPPGDPAPLPYLDDAADRESGGFGITLDVLLHSARMREQNLPPHRVSRASLAGMYWTMGQMVTHHASNGCNLRPGDLLASGTVSGPEPDARGCLLELAWRGTQPVWLPGGETRAFLQDGDEVILRGSCTRDGFARIGFGECRGTILPATS